MFRKKQRKACLNLIIHGHLPILTWIGFGCAVFFIRLINNNSLHHSNSVEPEWRVPSAPEEEKHMVMVTLNQTVQSSNFLTIDELSQSIDCSEESSYSSEEVKQRTAQFLSPSQILARTSDCDNYFTIIKTFGLAPFLESEMEYPLAFSHGVHTQPGLLELFLSLTFRPMDSHCIHIDAKASDEVQSAILGIVKCYNYRFKKANVFVAKHSIPVFWGHHSVLDIDLMCMRQLREAPRSQQKWRAILNPAGTELPLKSINTIRQIIFSKRENIIPIHHSINANRQATRFKLTRYGPGQYHLWNERVESCPKGPPPFNITVLKGSKNVILTREFVDFVLEDPIAIELYNWLKDTSVPDEHFYSTLATLEIEYIAATSARSVSQNMNMLQSNEEARQPKGICFRESLWGHSGCKGKNIHSICNFAMGDLEELKKSICFTGNKFNLEVDPVAPICIYKDVRHKTKLDRWREWKENELDKRNGVPEEPEPEENA
ncbi:hypothetical protein TCAL_10076 [Tigriopus californicus]|uniref:Uncharacterized protein n=1 Tax=Tigriopus californicus TaxID=6832 RepID=A0A553N711_TIGCA|nr:N-acetyllactosaminide beta-1,6-N-acetylglucosaminyl-transferase-like [Tigriopus californicus]TRY61224.1 hypothetical protein TCAL_10076 [Tigriopus californicus]|eukprot:TCALIF_10076-PA protein Name:"Similar to Gcnt2 N-acetyllactosaminide beta-1,6-N-acetylglucosaminyl-transferase (Mus musculus)" AED:0.12 eAED:0.12 QI:0/1/0.33/1/1/1/3/0/488